VWQCGIQPCGVYNQDFNTVAAHEQKQHAQQFSGQPVAGQPQSGSPPASQALPLPTGQPIALGPPPARYECEPEGRSSMLKYALVGFMIIAIILATYTMLPMILGTEQARFPTAGEIADAIAARPLFIQGPVNVNQTSPLIITDAPDPEVKVLTGSIGKLLPEDDVYKNWNHWMFDLPRGTKIVGVSYTISSSKDLHVSMFLTDGPYDHEEVVDDTELRRNILSPVNSGQLGTVNVYLPLNNYELREDLRLAVHAHNMYDHDVAFHASCTVFYTEAE
jgi:hypothetical protein